MRRLWYSVAMSLDGYIAGLRGEYDWIPMEADIDFAAIFGKFDTVLMGRRSFEAMSGGEPMPGGPLATMKTIVVSRTLDPREHPRVTIVSDHLKEAVSALKDQPGKDIWLWGGGDLFRSLLDLGLVDAVEVAVVPVVLGQGVPFVAPPAAQTSLRLRAHRVYEKTGTVLLGYDVR
jgi:dihydrofolate reductase